MRRIGCTAQQMATAGQPEGKPWQLQLQLGRLRVCLIISVAGKQAVNPRQQGSTPAGVLKGTKSAGSSRLPSGGSNVGPTPARVDWAATTRRVYKAVSTVSIVGILWLCYRLMTTLTPLIGHLFWAALASQVLIYLYIFLRYD